MVGLPLGKGMGKVSKKSSLERPFMRSILPMEGALLSDKGSVTSFLQQQLFEMLAFLPVQKRWEIKRPHF